MDEVPDMPWNDALNRLDQMGSDALMSLSGRCNLEAALEGLVSIAKEGAMLHLMAEQVAGDEVEEANLKEQVDAVEISIRHRFESVLIANCGCDPGQGALTNGRSV